MHISARFYDLQHPAFLLKLTAKLDYFVQKQKNECQPFKFATF